MEAISVKKVLLFLLPGLLVLILAGCAASRGDPVFDRIRESPAARLELPDGSAIDVDGEIAQLRSFADLRLQASPLEPADRADDWLYRIVFNPSDRVRGAEEIVVCFHPDYVQIGEEYYTPAEGVPYDALLSWAQAKFEYFFKR